MGERASPTNPEPKLERTQLFSVDGRAKIKSKNNEPECRYSLILPNPSQESQEKA